MSYVNHIKTDSSIIVVMSDGPKVIGNDNPLYADVLEAIANRDYESLPNKLDIASKIFVHTSGRFYVADGMVFLNGELVPEALSSRLMQFVDHGIDTKPLEKFWYSLSQNPSEDSKKSLYKFLENSNIPVTSDGNFLAYKRVTENFLDCHSRSFDNSIGKVVEMDRSTVDTDPDRTCSRGLHVAAYRYAEHFYPNGKLVEVKVDPRDVVTVPRDHNNEKMRVCRYKVVRECEGPREEPCVDEKDFDSNLEEPLLEETVQPLQNGALSIPYRILRSFSEPSGKNYRYDVDRGMVTITEDPNGIVCPNPYSLSLEIRRGLLVQSGLYGMIPVVSVYRDRIEIT